MDIALDRNRTGLAGSRLQVRDRRADSLGSRGGAPRGPPAARGRKAPQEARDRARFQRNGRAEVAGRPRASHRRPGRRLGTARPRHQCALLVLLRGPELDVRGLHRRPGEPLHPAAHERRAEGMLRDHRERLGQRRRHRDRPRGARRAATAITGEKWYVTSANLADYFILQARLADGPHAGSDALFFIDQDTPGIEVLRSPPFSHTFSAHHPTYRFQDVVVPEANRLGPEGDGMRFSHAWFRRERLMIAARCCGAAARLIEEATAFASTRLIGGEPLAEKQMVQAMLADSVTELWAARLITFEAARSARPWRRPEVAACALLDRKALCLGGGEPRRRPSPADPRRPRLHARELRRALLPRAAGRPDLGRRERGTAPHHRPRAR